MKLIISVLMTLGLAQAASAQELQPWQIELQKWEEEVKKMTELELTVKWTQHLTGTMLSCGASAAVAGVTLVADTVPATNILSEILANFVDEDYQSVASQGFVGETGNVLEGLFAGSGALVRDGVQFVLLAMTGETENAWKNVAKSYESSVVVTEKLFQDQALCTRLNNIELILRKELYSRLTGEEAADQQLLVVPQLH